MLEAEQFSRDRPRAIFEYEALLTEWRDVVASIAPVLGLPSRIDPLTAAAIDEFLTPELRHHRSSKADQSEAALPSIALRAYRALLDLVVAPASPEKSALQSLDDLRAELDNHISEHPAALKPELLARRRHITGQAIRINAAEQERDFFKARSEALAADLLRAERRVNELGSEFTALAEARRSQDDRIRELERLLSEAKVMAHEERQRLERRVNELGSELTALAEAGRSRDERILELERILAEANAQQQQDAAAAAQRVHALEQGIAEREHRLAALSAHFRYAVGFIQQHSRHGLLRRPLTR
jgi:chromosome segregation ATPase